MGKIKKNSKSVARTVKSKTTKRAASSERPQQERRTLKSGERLEKTFSQNVTGAAKKLRGKTIVAIVQKDGKSVKVGKTLYSSPTAAARAICERPTSGTQFWNIAK